MSSVNKLQANDSATKTTYFPEICSLDFNFDVDFQDKPATDWAVRGIGALEAKIQTYLGTRKHSTGFKMSKDEIPFHQLLNLAKEAFGHNGWSAEIIESDIVSNEETTDDLGQTRYSLTVQSLIRITLRDGTYHNEVGYGKADNLPQKSQAYSKAKKESITDGKKRGLQNLKHILFDYEENRRRGDDVYRNAFDIRMNLI